ncbi:MAG: hypothetical protein IJV54_10930 [Bacteroidales bacterium]|nr:hypothetical protein [Bacteroidales bacterium]
MKNTHKDIDTCVRNFRDALLASAREPDNEDYQIWESCAQYELEAAIEEKLKAQILADIAAWLRNELPF